MKIYECAHGHFCYSPDDGCFICDEDDVKPTHITDVEYLKKRAEEYKATGDTERKHMYADAVLLLLAEKTDPSIIAWFEKYGEGWYA